MQSCKKAGGEMKDKAKPNLDDSKANEEKKITENEKKTNDPSKKTLPGPPYFTGKRKHN